MFRVYDGTWGYDEHNPGFGDARFSPFDATDSGARVPTMYLARTPAAALLETVFHQVHQRSARNVYERDLVNKLMAHVRLPSDARLGDLRDAELARHRLARDQTVATSAEHYPCTRRLAVGAHGQRMRAGRLQGLIWHSRQAELAGSAKTAVVVIFADHYPSGRGAWVRSAPGSSNLFEGPGRLLVDELADQLDATVQPMA